MPVGQAGKSTGVIAWRLEQSTQRFRKRSRAHVVRMGAEVQLAVADRRQSALASWRVKSVLTLIPCRLARR
jgi:hypothetical protein